MRVRMLLVVVGILLLAWGCSRDTLSSDKEATEQEIAKMEEHLAEMKKKLAEEKTAAEEAGKQAPGAEQQVAHAKRTAPVVKTVTLEPGTPITVRTTSTISTKAARTGEHFTASLEEPLMDGMKMIAPKGARVEGVVVESDKGGRVKGKAVLAVTLSSLTTGNGKRVKIATNTIGNEAKSAKKKDATKVGIGAAVGTVIGAIAGGGKGAAIGAGVGAGAGGAGVLLTRGNAAEIPSETVLHFELAGPVTVAVK